MNLTFRTRLTVVVCSISLTCVHSGCQSPSSQPIEAPVAAQPWIEGFETEGESLPATSVVRGDTHKTDFAIVTTDRFRPEGHFFEVKELTKDDATRLFIDGKFAWGTGGMDKVEYPAIETIRIDVVIGKKRFVVPRTQIQDLFDLNTDPNPYPHSARLKRESGETIASLVLLGSDGYASYRVLFTFKRDGKILRAVNVFDGP